MSQATIWSRIVPILIFLVLLVLLAVGLTRDPKLIPSELIDRPMPPFALSELHDEKAIVSNINLRGQVSLINVFGSWCAACVVEHPILMKIAQRGDVQLIGVNWRDTRPDAIAWLERYGDPYHRIAFDETSELAIELGVTGAPETFLVDPKGRIRYKQVGQITDEVWAETIAPILSAIAEERE